MGLGLPLCASRWPFFCKILFWVDPNFSIVIQIIYNRVYTTVFWIRGHGEPEQAQAQENLRLQLQCIYTIFKILSQRLKCLSGWVATYYQVNLICFEIFFYFPHFYKPRTAKTWNRAVQANAAVTPTTQTHGQLTSLANGCQGSSVVTMANTYLIVEEVAVSQGLK